jgi:hypothetical protein
VKKAAIMQTPEQVQLLSYVNMVCTPFSIAGASYMIYSYFQSCTKSFSSRLVFCLALSDMLLSIVDLIEIFNPNEENCVVVGFLRIAGIYSNMLWTTQILGVLYVQFVWEYAGVDRLFPYLVAMNVLLSLVPNLWTLYDMNFGGELYYAYISGECFIGPQSAFPVVLIIPFAVLLTLSIFMTIKVYLVFRAMATNLGNIEYKSLFMYPAVLVILDVPISVDYAMQHTVFWLTFTCLIMLKSIGLINALQFRRASNSRAKIAKETQQDVILRTLSQEDSSFT